MFDFKLDHKGYIRRRESFDLEFKQNFQHGDNIIKYVKTIAGMANNKGGEIVFGIKDSPHEPIGMTNNRFRETDPKIIDKTIREYFSHELEWNMNIVPFAGKEFGLISVKESSDKPVLCKKNNKDILREGAIYYRYRGETKEIEYAELRNILDKEREKERILWIKHIEKISMIGPKNVHLLDSYKGELSMGEHKILLDKSIIDKLNFIKAGKFVESDEEGLPTLKLIGDVEGVNVEDIAAKPDVLYPFTTSDLQAKLGLNSYEIQTIIHKLDLKNKPKYHAGISIGKNKDNTIHKYTESLVPVLQRMLNHNEFLPNCIEEYKLFCKNRPKKKRNQRR